MTITLHSLVLRARTAWLRIQVDAYSRQLHSIGVQRENDFQAERILHRNISAARTELRDLTQDSSEPDPISVSLSPKSFRPRLVELVRKSATDAKRK